MKIKMTAHDEPLAFLKRKWRLIDQLDHHIFIPKQWESLITEAERLGLEASKAQLQRYYDHYSKENPEAIKS